MPIVTTKAMLLDAQKNGYAVPAFNVENMEMMQAVVFAAIAQKSPVILQTTPSTLKHATPKLFFNMASALISEVSVPIALHLDHGNSFDLAVNAIRAGYTSIMIDGSATSFEENIAITKKVVELASAVNVPVEAELGTLGGKEDSHVVADEDAKYTNPEKAVIFMEKTGAFSLAIAIGTAHGHYKGLPKLDFDRLEAIKKLIKAPLVLHGTSGVPDDDVKKCVSYGMCKVNYATELRDMFTKGVREILIDTKVYDPKAYVTIGRQYVQECVEQKMIICGSAGRAK